MITNEELQRFAEQIQACQPSAAELMKSLEAVRRAFPSAIERVAEMAANVERAARILSGKPSA